MVWKARIAYPHQLVAPFQFSQPDFYSQYKNARQIVDYTGRGQQKPEVEEPEMLKWVMM